MTRRPRGEWRRLMPWAAPVAFVATRGLPALALMQAMIVPFVPLAAAADVGDPVAVARASSGGGMAGFGDAPAAATAFVLGVTAGVMHVDLPSINDPNEDFSTRPRFGFDFGGELRPWLECGVEVGFTMLGESDSLQAILDAEGTDAAAVVTHVQWLASVRARRIREASRWSPYVRCGAGMATLWVSAPGDLGSHASDPAWCAGVGLEFYPHPRLLLRAEGTYIGQAESGRAHHHAAATLGVLYAMPRSLFGGGA